MEQFFEIMAIVLPVFLVVGLGYGVKKTSMVDGEFLFQINRLIYYLALPSLLFYKIATADFSTSFNGALVIALSLTVLIGFVLSYGFGIFKKYPDGVRGSFSQAAFRGNFAYVGLAIVYNAYGEAGLAIAGVLLGFVVPIMNLISIVALLLPHQDSRIKPVFLIKQIIFNPLIVASMLGVGWSFLHLPIPIIFDRALHIVTGMALPLALISIGASFSLEKLRGDMSLTFLATGFKLIFMPLLAVGFFHLCGVQGRDLGVGVLLAGTPTATAAYIMSQQMQGDAELSGAIIMLSTLFSVVSYSLILMVLKYLGL